MTESSQTPDSSKPDAPKEKKPITRRIVLRDGHFVEEDRPYKEPETKPKIWFHFIRGFLGAASVAAAVGIPWYLHGDGKDDSDPAQLRSPTISTLPNETPHDLYPEIIEEDAAFPADMEGLLFDEDLATYQASLEIQRNYGIKEISASCGSSISTYDKHADDLYVFIEDTKHTTTTTAIEDSPACEDEVITVADFNKLH